MEDAHGLVLMALHQLPEFEGELKETLILKRFCWLQFRLDFSGDKLVVELKRIIIFRWRHVSIIISNLIFMAFGMNSNLYLIIC